MVIRCKGSIFIANWYSVFLVYFFFCFWEIDWQINLHNKYYFKNDNTKLFDALFYSDEICGFFSYAFKLFNFNWLKRLIILCRLLQRT